MGENPLEDCPELNAHEETKVINQMTRARTMTTSNHHGATLRTEAPNVLRIGAFYWSQEVKDSRVSRGS